MEWIDAARDAGVATTIMIVGYLIVRSVLGAVTQMITMWTGAVAKRADADTAIAEANERIADHVASLTKAHRASTELITGMRRDAHIAQGATLEVLGDIKEAVDNVPERVRGALHDDLSAIQKKAEELALAVVSLRNKIEYLATVTATAGVKADDCQDPAEQTEDSAASEAAKDG